jgi:hypothetical protein
MLIDDDTLALQRPLVLCDNPLLASRCVRTAYDTSIIQCRGGMKMVQLPVWSDTAAKVRQAVQRVRQAPQAKLTRLSQLINITVY